MDESEVPSTARLHAAAPEMYEALSMLCQEELGEFIYDIRDNEMEGWDGPRVKNWWLACMKAAAALKKARMVL